MSLRSPRLIDLSHTIEHGMVTYKGLPAPVVGDWYITLHGYAAYSGVTLLGSLSQLVAAGPSRASVSRLGSEPNLYKAKE